MATCFDLSIFANEAILSDLCFLMCFCFITMGRTEHGIEHPVKEKRVLRFFDFKLSCLGEVLGEVPRRISTLQQLLFAEKLLRLVALD